MNNTTFISMLKGERQLRNMTQSDVAEILGVTPSFYNMVERNKKRFPKSKLGLLLNTVVDMEYGRLLSIYEGLAERDFEGLEFDTLIDLDLRVIKIGSDEFPVYVEISPEEVDRLRESFRLGHNLQL